MFPRCFGQIGLQFLLFLFLICFLLSCGEENKERLKIGDQAPDFVAYDINGKKIHLASWKGNPVILRFWDTECKYCRADTPVFSQYFKEYKKKGLKVVYINTGKEGFKIVTEFIKELKIPFPVVMEKGDEVAARFNVRVVPQTVILDPDQKIIAAILGGVGEAELKELVGEYLR